MWSHTAPDNDQVYMAGNLLVFSVGPMVLMEFTPEGLLVFTHSSDIYSIFSKTADVTEPTDHRRSDLY